MSTITFLRSTTTTTIDREADNEVTTRVKHVARFAVADPPLDIGAEDYRNAAFRPNWMEVVWENGKLDTVKVSGPRRLAAGTLSDRQTLHRTWGRWSNKAVDRGDLPGDIAERIGRYESDASETGAVSR